MHRAVAILFAHCGSWLAVSLAACLLTRAPAPQLSAVACRDLVNTSPGDEVVTEATAVTRGRDRLAMSFIENVLSEDDFHFLQRKTRLNPQRVSTTYNFN